MAAATAPSCGASGAEFALQLENRHQAAADQVAAAQIRQIPFKLANKWIGPYTVLSVLGVAVRLDLPVELGHASNMVNMRRLKLFEARDVPFSVDDMPLRPLEDSAGMGNPAYRGPSSSQAARGDICGVGGV